MSIFDLIHLLGGLGLFLYGMRMMGDGLKESASGPLKRALEQLTSNTFKAFLLGFAMTAVIQSSKATIVITAGLVATGILSMKRSVGILVGANIGTTVTGQIIRLMDLNASGPGASIIEFFNPSTLGPLAVIIGVGLTMFAKDKKAAQADKILIGFGILFTGLISMTDSVSSLTESPMISNLFMQLDNNLIFAFAIGAGVAFVLQSASASVGVIQAFSVTGLLSFTIISSMLMGIYLGECITTMIVCSVGANTESKRVGVVNVVYNVFKIISVSLILVIMYFLNIAPGLWDEAVTSGTIANANTIFNIVSAVVLFPFLNLFTKITVALVKEKPKEKEEVDELLSALNPAFFSTPAIAFGVCYDAILEMFRLDISSIHIGMNLVHHYDPVKAGEIKVNEDRIDELADHVSDYLVSFSSHISTPNQREIFNQYVTVVNELERLSDHAVNIAGIADDLHKNHEKFTDTAINELKVLEDLLNKILEFGYKTFEKRDIEAARKIEPLEQVMDDIIVILKDNYMTRLEKGQCSVFAGSEFINLLTEIERLSDISSNIGVATIARVLPEIKHQIHDYIHKLHAGKDEIYNREYHEAQELYFNRLRMSSSDTV